MRDRSCSQLPEFQFGLAATVSAGLCGSFAWLNDKTPSTALLALSVGTGVFAAVMFTGVLMNCIPVIACQRTPEYDLEAQINEQSPLIRKSSQGRTT